MTDTLLLIDAKTDLTASFAEAGAQRVRTPEEISESYRAAQSGTRWVTETRALDFLTQVLLDLLPSEPEQALLLFGRRLHYERWQFLNAYFHTLVFADPGGRFLRAEEMAEVMASDAARDFVIGGDVDERDQIVLLYRGTLDRIPIPFAFFRASGTGKTPDFAKFSVTDWGQTLRFGDYEASVESVLYERDPEFRKRAKANRLKHDKTFGGAFRRLRLLRGLTQSSFTGVSEREIRRIEQNQIAPGKIRAETRRIVEQQLGATLGEINTY